MMTSNAYIASDGASVMKVGKANDVQRREKQIGVSITVTVACLDEQEAVRVEDKLRNFVIERGGSNIKGRLTGSSLIRRFTRCCANSQ